MAIIYGTADSETQLLNNLPNEVENIDDIDRVKNEFEKKLRKKDTGFFAGIRKWDYQRQLDKFEDNKNSPVFTGAKGENTVIEEISKLDDDYHIMCGMQIELPYYVTYNGRKNLRSAQMDIVVICPKGVFMIEVKNWSDRYAQSHDKLNPYEQTERAGRILWITLQNIIKNIRVTNVLLSIQGNLHYDENYRSVFVSSLDKINQFLEKKQTILNKNQIKEIVSELEYYLDS